MLIGANSKCRVGKCFVTHAGFIVLIAIDVVVYVLLASEMNTCATAALCLAQVLSQRWFRSLLAEC